MFQKQLGHSKWNDDAGSWNIIHFGGGARNIQIGGARNIIKGGARNIIQGGGARNIPQVGGARRVPTRREIRLPSESQRAATLPNAHRAVPPVRNASVRTRGYVRRHARMRGHVRRIHLADVIQAILRVVIRIPTY